MVWKEEGMGITTHYTEYTERVITVVRWELIAQGAAGLIEDEAHEPGGAGHVEDLE
jgi:hypothetical protein